jgi:hypothetical protein
MDTKPSRIAVRLFDGAAQLAELVGLAEHVAWILRACAFSKPDPREK